MSKVSRRLNWYNQKLKVTHPDGTVKILLRRELMQIMQQLDMLYEENRDGYTVYGEATNYHFKVVEV